MADPPGPYDFRCGPCREKPPRHEFCDWWRGCECKADVCVPREDS